MIRLLVAAIRVLRWLSAFLESGGSTTSPPSISAVRPATGWPGSLISIDGGGFGPELDDNQVSVGGVPALVVRSAPASLTVLVGENATSGPSRSGGRANRRRGRELSRCERGRRRPTSARAVRPSSPTARSTARRRFAPRVIVGVPPGRYEVQAFSASTLESAEAESPVRVVDVKS